MNLVKAEKEPAAISDPVLRRSVQLQRLQTAMKVCREAGNTVDAAMTILIGAEAVQTDAALRELLRENPDLAVIFASDAASRIVLRDPDEIQHHGPFIMHRMSIDANEGHWSDVREGLRRLQAWYRRRQDEIKTDDHPFGNKWPISLIDNAAVAEALARTEGPESVLRRLRPWGSKYLLSLTISICENLIASGEPDRLAEWLSIGKPTRLFQFIPLTFLALAGRKIDCEALLLSLERITRVGHIDQRDLDQRYGEIDEDADLIDLFLTGCEVALTCGAPKERIMPLIASHRPASIRKPGYVRHADRFALALRAHALFEVLSGNRNVGKSFFLPDEQGERDEKSRSNRSRRDEEAEILIGAFASTYEERALFLTDKGTLEDVPIPNSRDDYRLDAYSRMSKFPLMRARAAVSVARLCHLPSAAISELAEKVVRIGDVSKGYLPSGEILYLRSLNIRTEWHEFLSDKVAKRAEDIRRLRMSAEDKSNALVQLSRLLVPFNLADGREIFNWAVDAAGEVDRNLAHGLVLFEPLVHHGLSHMNLEARRNLAGCLSVVASDVGIRLAGTDAFPWKQLIAALIELDLGIALAAIARWDDEDLVRRYSTLPMALRAGASSGVIDPEFAVSLLQLLRHVEEDTLIAVITSAHTSRQKRKLAEEIARDECLFFGRGQRPAIFTALQNLIDGKPIDGWLYELQVLTTFHEHTSPTRRNEKGLPPETSTLEKNVTPLDSFDFSGTCYKSPQSIDQTLKKLLQIRKEKRAHFDLPRDFSSTLD